MLISEIFYSIQGEGGLVGVPSVFVRTSGCNLRCAWCDTPYASWNPEGVEMDGLAVIEAIRLHPTRHVVVTGGEPMVARGIGDLLAALRRAGYHVTLETAGTVFPDGAVVDLASISPKLSNSTPDAARAGAAWVDRHEATRLQPQVIRAWIQEAGDYQLKFVISSADDVREARQLIEALGADVPPEKVLLMPEGTSVEAMHARHDFIVEACKQHGYRFSPRLHIDLFGNLRGT